MAVCKLCEILNPSDVKKEPFGEDEMQAHVDCHLLHLKLVNMIGLSADKLWEKCFPSNNTKVSNDRNETSNARPIHSLCRRLFAKRKNKATCGECGFKLVVCDPKSGYIRVDAITDHACVHLGKPLYKCCLCDHQCATTAAMKGHLDRVHKLNNRAKNCIDLSVTYQQEIMDTIKRCFAVKSENRGKHLSIVRKRCSFRSVAPDSYAFLLNYCRERLKTQLDNGINFCSECNRKLVTIGKNGRINSGPAVSHACLHLGKFLFKCKHCDKQYLSKLDIDNHLRKIRGSKNVSSNDYVDLTGSHKQEIISMIDRCFGNPRTLHHDGGKRICSMRQVQNPITNFCRNLLVGRNRNERVPCLECGGQFKVFIKAFTELRPQSLIDHACNHLGKQIFTCRCCNFGALTQIGVRTHLKTHGLSSKKENYIDSSSKYQNEIMAMLERCFKQTGQTSKVKDEKNEAMIVQSSRAAALIRSRAGGDTLAAARQLKCYDLVRRFSKSGRLNCRLCPKNVAVAGCKGFLMSQLAMAHAMSHMSTPVFHCRQCSAVGKTKEYMRDHNRWAHKEKTGFDDQSDDFQDEILDNLSKCFDWSEVSE